MFKSFLSSISLMFLSFLAMGQIQNPDDFFPDKLGEHFMPHHSIVSYFQHLAKESNRAKYISYGQSNEKRPLGLMILSSEENIKNLEDIRIDNLRLTGIENGSPKRNQKTAIVWISFGVHGNEAGATNSSIATVYDLLSGSKPEIENWLENTVVIIDPCLNPDGYSHYTDWNRAVGNKVANPHIESWEHNEPWPGGRVNHYLFDLNRDWAWATQIETQQRLTIYNQWMPHIHVDVHEQMHNDPYYFAPAAQPFHKYITEWQGEFQTEIGINHTKYFDDAGWLYFTREIFDLFYPSYGDTYPTFKGAIGMTYEQAGHTHAGREIIIENGDTLTLQDRIEHHNTTALSTIEVASKNADRLVDNFKKYYSSDRSKGEYSAFIIKASKSSRQKIKSMCELLDLHNIKYGNAKSSTQKVNGFDFNKTRSGTFSIAEKDLVIPVDQVSGTLVEVLFEPSSDLVDSLTYDITAWSLPYAHGLEAYASKQKIEITEKYQGFVREVQVDANNAYAYLVPWNNLKSTSFLADCQKEGIVVRSAWKDFSIEDRSHKAGTLIILRSDNQNKFSNNLFGKLMQLAQIHDIDMISTKSGYVKSGHDFGSENIKIVEPVRLAVLSGEPVSQYAFGHVWHFCEQTINYPLSVLDINSLSNSILSKYNVLIMPDGYYSGIDDSVMSILNTWVHAGGKMIAIQGAVNKIAKDVTYLMDEKTIARNDSNKEESKLKKFGDQGRGFLTKHMPGAIYKLSIDETHPLNFGLQDHYFSLKTNSKAYSYLTLGWNVAYTEKEVNSIGFTGHKLKDIFRQTTSIAVQSKGKGSVVLFMDNPVYRGFWKQGAFLLGNAIFIVQ